MLIAFGKFAPEPQKAFIQKWEKKAESMLKEFEPSELADCLYALGKYYTELTSDLFLAKWEEAVKPHLKHFKPGDLVNTLYGWGLNKNLNK